MAGFSAMNRSPKIGLALGSGSARGLAHLGVIRALLDAGIKVDCIAGTSMGALIGAIYAAGKLDLLEATFLGFDWKKTLSFFDIVLPKSGLLDGARIGELVRAHVHADCIEKLPKPFAAVATDIVSGEEVDRGGARQYFGARHFYAGSQQRAYPGGRWHHQSGAGERCPCAGR
jgi:NTE family protein